MSFLFFSNLEVLKQEHYSHWISLSTWNLKYRWIAIAGIYIFSLTALWYAIFGCPLWLLRINNILKQYITIALLGFLNTTELPARFLLLVGFFQNLPKSLDAWTGRQVTSLHQRFDNKVSKSPLSRPTIASFIKPDRVKVQQYAKLIAWECLKQTYQPAAIERERVLHVIAKLYGHDTAEDYLWFLEKHLGMIQTIGKAQVKIRFTHDLLAEYLASLYLIEICHNNEANWRQFLRRVDAMPNKQAIRDFLVAVWDCSKAAQIIGKVPNFVPEELGKRIGSVSRLNLRVPMV